GIIREQPRDVGMATELGGLARPDQRVDRAAREQRAERLGAGVLVDRYRPQQRRRARLAVAAGLFHRALDPADGVKIDTELVHEMTARPDRRGLGIERQAGAPAFEIFWRGYAPPGVDEDVAVAEHPRRKHRQRDERTIAATVQADKLGRRQLGHVEFPPADHAVEHLAAGFQRDAVEVDAFDRDCTLADGFHPVVAAAGEAQRQAGHGGAGGAQRRRDCRERTGTLLAPTASLRIPRRPCPRQGKPPAANGAAQRLENWNERRALARPYFLRSTTRGSRVRKPPRLSTARRSGSKFISALDRPWRTAPAWPDSPPPDTVQVTSYWPLRLVATSGCWISMRSTGRAK